MRWRLVAVLAAALFVPLALSQDQAAPGVEVAIKETEGIVTVEAKKSFPVVIRNTSPTTGTPLDDQNVAEVVVETQDVPAGWTAVAVPSAFELAAGKERTVQLEVTVALEATDLSATIKVVATLTSPFEPLDPLLGQAPGASQTATGEDSIKLTVSNSATRDLLETVGGWIYLVLLALVAAVVIAVGLTIAGRRTLIRLSTESHELEVQPGGRVSFPIKAESLAKITNTVLFQLSAVPEGWAAFLPVPELAVEPGQVYDLSLVVISPRSAGQGTRQAVLVSATSTGAPKRQANLEFVAVVSGPPTVPPAEEQHLEKVERRRKES